MNDKFEKPYLAVTVRHVTRDMSVGNMEKKDFYISAHQLIPGEKLPKPAGVSLYGDYTVLQVDNEVVKLCRNGDEIVLVKDAGPVNGSSCGSSSGGVYGSSSVEFEYRTPLSRKEINRLAEMALDAASCPGTDWLESSNRHIDVLDFVERAVKEGNTGLYVALALLNASSNWEYCNIHRPGLFRKIFTEGLRKGALAPDIDNPAWEWMDIAIMNNDPGEFTDDMELYYDILATAAENGVLLARDIIDMIWEPENCQEED